MKKLFQFCSKHPLFVLTVLLPTILAVLYYGFYASDIYTSESSFVVRTPGQPSSSSLGGILASSLSGHIEAPADAAAVNNFILSRDALKILNEQLDLKKYFSSPKIDIFHRFGLFGRDHFEDLYDYYLKRIDIRQGSSPDISILRVNLFSPRESQEVNEILIKAAEKKVNQLNERMRRDLIYYSEREVKDAENRAKEAALALANFRNQKEVVDPERQTTFHFDKLGKLQMELISARTQLEQILRQAPSSPAPDALKIRINALEGEIRNEQERVAGSEFSLATLAAEFEKLALEREFADQQLSLSLASLQNARNEAQRQQIYLERIANPSLPDVAMNPKRLRSIITVFVVGLILWAVLSILLSGVLEHKNK